MKPVFAAVQEYARVFGVISESPSSSDSGSSMELTDQLTNELDSNGGTSVHDMILEAISQSKDFIANQSAKFYHSIIPDLVFQLVDPKIMKFLSDKDEQLLKTIITDPIAAINQNWEAFVDMDMALASASKNLNLLLEKKQEYKRFWNNAEEENLKKTVSYAMTLYFHYKKVALEIVFSPLRKHEKLYLCKTLEARERTNPSTPAP